ncbi:MAG: nucleotidyltransferase domain-containing protein [Armatimonadota bacterium]|nr:nucleotidyltransferase domain-containing protein [Armatimonadota bacterium]
MMTVKQTLKQSKAALEDYYGSRLKALVLYGSLARGRGEPGSDIDLLVLLDEPFDYFLELRRIVDLLYPIQLETDRLISAMPAPIDEFDSGSIELYRSARREGQRV